MKILEMPGTCDAASRPPMDMDDFDKKGYLTIGENGETCELI